MIHYRQMWIIHGNMPQYLYHSGAGILETWKFGFWMQESWQWKEMPNSCQEDKIYPAWSHVAMVDLKSPKINKIFKIWFVRKRESQADSVTALGDSSEAYSFGRCQNVTKPLPSMRSGKGCVRYHWKIRVLRGQFKIFPREKALVA